jgi:hypothetical protein
VGRAGAPGQGLARGAPSGHANVTRGRGGVVGTAAPPSRETWRTRGGAAAQAEVAGAMKRATGSRAVASASSSSAASAQDMVPSRMPLIMGSASLKGEIVLNRAPSPLEPSPKLSAGRTWIMGSHG